MCSLLEHKRGVGLTVSGRGRSTPCPVHLLEATGLQVFVTETGHVGLWRLFSLNDAKVNPQTWGFYNRRSYTQKKNCEGMGFGWSLAGGGYGSEPRTPVNIPIPTNID